MMSIHSIFFAAHAGTFVVWLTLPAVAYVLLFGAIVVIYMGLRWLYRHQRGPVPMAFPRAEEGIIRRQLVNWLIRGGLLGFLASVLWPLIRYVIPPDVEAGITSGVVEAGTLEDFPVNSGKIVRFGNQPVIVIRTPEGDVRAFSAICTHLACIVQYRPDLEHIWCACHNGHYDLTGKNIAGPPPRPLPPFEVKIKENRIFISRGE